MAAPPPLPPTIEAGNAVSEGNASWDAPPPPPQAAKTRFVSPPSIRQTVVSPPRAPVSVFAAAAAPPAPTVT